MNSHSEPGRGQDPADDETIAKAEEANRLAAEHGVADPGGIAGAADAGDTVPPDRPGAHDASGPGDNRRQLDDIADDAIEETGPPQ